MAGILTFRKEEVSALIAETEEGKSHLVAYTGGEWGPPADTTPGLVLVGDDGIYLMSNRTDYPDTPDTEGKRNVAYAFEANPDKMDCDDVWDAKVKIFGGDDGCIPIDLETVKQWVKETTHESCVQLILTHNSIKFLTT